MISVFFFKTEKIHSIVPYYYFPTTKNLQKESLNIGKNAYQLLYFGKYEESLNLAKLAVKINEKDEKLWLILSEAQVANKLYKEALNSLNNAENINSNISEIYFAKSKIYLQILQQKNAKIALRICNKKERFIVSAFFICANPSSRARYKQASSVL